MNARGSIGSIESIDLLTPKVRSCSIEFWKSSRLFSRSGPPFYGKCKVVGSAPTHTPTTNHTPPHEPWCMSPMCQNPCQMPRRSLLLLTVICHKSSLSTGPTGGPQKDLRSKVRSRWPYIACGALFFQGLAPCKGFVFCTILKKKKKEKGWTRPENWEREREREVEAEEQSLDDSPQKNLGDISHEKPRFFSLILFGLFRLAPSPPQNKFQQATPR